MKAGSFVLLLEGSLVVRSIRCVKGTLVLTANSTYFNGADVKNNTIIMKNNLNFIKFVSHYVLFLDFYSH